MKKRKKAAAHPLPDIIIRAVLALAALITAVRWW